MPIYMRIDGMKGDLTRPTPSTEYAIASFDTEISNATTIGSATGGAGAGKAKLMPITVKRKYHAESNIDLNLKLCMGTMIPTIDFIGYIQDKMTTKFTIGMVFVTNIKTSCDMDQYTEEIEFTYGTIKWFAAQGANPLNPQTGQGWDMTKNMKF